MCLTFRNSQDQLDNQLGHIVPRRCFSTEHDGSWDEFCCRKRFQSYRYLWKLHNHEPQTDCQEFLYPANMLNLFEIDNKDTTVALEKC